MSNWEREFVSATSATGARNGAGFNPCQGLYFKPKGAKPKTAFIAKYRAAQKARNDRLTDWCHAELERLKQLNMVYRAFNMYRTWADLRLMDGAIDPSERVVGICYAGDHYLEKPADARDNVADMIATWLKSKGA